MSRQERFPYPRPPVRPLKIYAFDPMVGLDKRTRVSVETRNEPLQPGPLGARLAIVDYDVAQDCFYTPVDLDDPAILMQGGIDHSEGDPRFHQQMVYAVASRIVAIFDRALGRPVDLGSSKGDGKAKPLRLFPHAMEQRNAFYDPDSGSIFFGYFRAPEMKDAANIPGQIIFLCLSHDVIAHELTHALIHQLSPALINSEHPDTWALHEGLSDLVAILHRFSLESVVRDEIQRTNGVLDVSSPLCQVATQFGAGMGMLHGLRNARSPADPTQYATVLEPHARGALLISATLEALFRAYRAQVQDLMDIAGVATAEIRKDAAKVSSSVNDKKEESSSEGASEKIAEESVEDKVQPSSVTPAFNVKLHPDLVNRLAGEVSRLAKSLLTMCIRAFDYLPPVDVSFGDFLRSVVTADWELSPEDSSGLRTALIESFRSRGIYATGARSLAEESLVWERPTLHLDPFPPMIVAALTQTAQGFGRIRPGEGEKSAADRATHAAHRALSAYAKKNAARLFLWRNGATLRPPSTRYCFRVGADGQLAIDIIAKFVQERRQGDALQYRGTTLVASADGSVRYAIRNQPVPQFSAGKDQRAPEAAVEKEVRPSQAFRKPTFAARFRMTPAEFARAFPSLKLSKAEMKTFKTNFAYNS